MKHESSTLTILPNPSDSQPSVLGGHLQSAALYPNPTNSCFSLKLGLLFSYSDFISTSCSPKFYSFQHQLQSLSSKLSSRCHLFQSGMGQIQDTIHLRAKFLCSWKVVQLDKLHNSKIQWWEMHGLEILIPNGEKRKRELWVEFMGAKQVWNLAKNITFDFKVQTECSWFEALPFGCAVVVFPIQASAQVKVLALKL